MQCLIGTRITQRFGLGGPNEMPTPATSNLPIPKDWNEFEEICADLFSKEWGDRNATRNGRQGQRHNGVDIYGSPSTGGLAGVQCKGKRAWPPKQLTTA